VDGHEASLILDHKWSFTPKMSGFLYQEIRFSLNHRLSFRYEAVRLDNGKWPAIEPGFLYKHPVKGTIKPFGAVQYDFATRQVVFHTGIHF